jgi:hypothetical protein
MIPAFAVFALVPPHEKVLEEIAYELQRNILECERRTVKQLQQMQVLLFVQCHQRCDIVGAECCVAAVDDVFQVVGRNLFWRDVQGEDLIGQLLKRIVAPFAQEVGREGWDVFGDEEATIAGKAFQDDLFEGKLICFSA